MRVLVAIRQLEREGDRFYVEDVAAELDHTVKVVKVHLDNICERLGIRTRVTLTEMADAAERAGVILDGSSAAV